MMAIRARYIFLSRCHFLSAAVKEAFSSDPHAQKLAGVDDHSFDNVVSAVAPQI